MRHENETDYIDDLAYVRRMVRTGTARKLRQQLGLSGRKASAELGVSPNCVEHWEKGMVPSAGALRKYAAMLRRLEAL